MFSNIFNKSSTDSKDNDDNDSHSNSDDMPGDQETFNELSKQIEALKRQLDQTTAGSSSNNTVNAVTEVKLVPFYENDPDLWFKIIEA